ncbi:MAG: hypothetical protein JWM68_1205 [Verrucomicrobiales bacterium]|nr:hypothetical protein [Verrucomicrobiales bacterium]
MVPVILFLLTFLGSIVYMLILRVSGGLPLWIEKIDLWFLCAAAGGLGGCVYCLRGVYLNACVRKQWDKDWLPWYLIRPFISLVCGAVSCLFLKAGLLVLEAGKKSEASDLGFFALAFIAGLNVDKFLSKIEDLAQAAWGIEKSRAGKGDAAKKDE